MRAECDAQWTLLWQPDEGLRPQAHASFEVSDRVLAVDGKPAVRPVMTLSLSSDHRVIDGARAAAFLNDLVEAIRKPEELLPL